MIQDEERHADFLEAQLHSIKEMGIGTYLAQQLHGEWNYHGPNASPFLTFLSLGVWLPLLRIIFAIEKSRRARRP